MEGNAGRTERRRKGGKTEKQTQKQTHIDREIERTNNNNNNGRMSTQ